MNGLDRITARIAEDAKKENDTALMKAQEEAEALVSSYKKQAEERTAVLLPKAALTAAENTSRRLATAAMESRKLELAAKQRTVAKAFQEAGVALTKLDTAKKVSWLAAVAAKASRTGAEALVLDVSEHADIGPKVVTKANKLLGARGKLRLAENGRALGGGLVLSDGDIEVNCTVTALIEAAREELSTEVGKILFS